MSTNNNNSNEFLQCENMLKGLLLPDNNARSISEAQLQEYLSTNQNKEKLAIFCSQLLTNSNDLSVQIYCAIIIRKIFMVSDDKVSDIVKFFSNETKQILKNNLLNALNTCNNKGLLKKISDSMINYFNCLCENDENWNELLTFVLEIFNLPLNENNIEKIEIGLYFLSNIYRIAYDDLKDKIDLYIKCFKIYFDSNSLSLKSKTVQCINELLSSCFSKKESKKFKDFIYNILETTLNCLKAHDNENLKVCLESLNDLSAMEPKILRKNFSDIFILMGKIIEEKDIDDSLREISYELLVTLIEAMPKVIDKNEEKIKILIQSIFKYAMEIDDTIDAEWLKPSSITYISDEFIPEEKLDESTSLLSRLLKSLDENMVLKIISDNIIDLIGHSNDKDWKYKYIAYITIAEIVGFIHDINSIEKLIEMILNDLFNQNVKVQYSAIYCIAEISDSQEPDFQNMYHEKVLPNLFKILKESKILRIQLECCDAIDCFLEHVTDEQAAKYMNNALEILFEIFMKDDNECPSSLKEAILEVIQELIESNNEEFKKYSEKCFEILLNYLGNILQNNINKNLIGVLLETISTIGPLCPELFKKHLIKLVDILNQIQSNLNSYKENIANFLESTWEKLIPMIKENNKEKLPEIIDSLIILLNKPPQMSVSSNPNKKINIQEFFQENNKKNEEEKKVTLETSETEEFSTFIEILNIILENSPELCNLNQVESIYNCANSLLKYPNENIQQEIAKTFGNLVKVLFALKMDVNKIHEFSKKNIVLLVEQLNKEKDFTSIVAFLDGIREIINTTKLFLTTNEINDLCEKLLIVFNNVEKNRISLNKQKLETEKEYEEDKKKGDNKIFSDDEDKDSDEEEVIEDIKDQIEELENVQSSFSDFFGTLFDTHKNLSLEIVEKLIKEYLPKYFSDNSSTFEKKLGVLIIDDMIEFLQQNLIGNIWKDLFQILVKYSIEKDYELRNASAYGLGIFSRFTTQNFKEYEKDLLNAINNAMTFPSDVPKEEKDNMKFARDNAVSALGKVIKYHGAECDNLQELINLWVNNLPITEDHEEARLNHKFLMEILKQDSTKILGTNFENLNKVILIVSKIYNTDNSDDDIDKDIKEIAKNIKQNEQFKNILDQTLNNAKKGKTTNRIKDLFYKD